MERAAYVASERQVRTLGRRAWRVMQVDGAWHVRSKWARESRAICDREAEALLIATFLNTQIIRGDQLPS